MEQTLDTICSLLADTVGPDIEAINRFSSKESPKFEMISERLAELEILLESVTHLEQYQNSSEMAVQLENMFSSIDALGHLVDEIRRRVTMLEKEVDRRSPSMFGRFLKPKETITPCNLKDIPFEADSLLELYGFTVQG